MRLTLDPKSPADYETFLRVKRLPKYRVVGRTVEFPDEYAAAVGVGGVPAGVASAAYAPAPFLFDYQRDIAALAIRKRKFAAFVRCGLGKSLILLEFARHCRAAMAAGRRVLIVSPLMVVDQLIGEAAKFYGMTLPIVRVKAKDLAAWCAGATGDAREIGVTNYDALDDSTPQGTLGALILDESAMLKSQYGKWGQACIRLGRGLEWKLALTGLCAPNDRIEYANHAVFLDHFPTVNSFLARFFVNRGQTDNRWEMKPHALGSFYRALSHWSIFLNNPSTYGWRDNATGIPPIHVHVEDVGLTDAQKRVVQDETGMLFGGAPGGIATRGKMAQLAKGNHNGAAIDTLKPEYIRRRVASWPKESTIVWCRYNDEQASMERTFPGAASVEGSTPYDARMRMVDDFKAGRVKILISKPKVLGFGLNLQVATRHVFSTLQDSLEEFHQAVHRSNRVGSTVPLNVHIPITAIERPMVQTVLDKAARVDRDTAEQELIFKESARDFLTL